MKMVNLLNVLLEIIDRAGHGTGGGLRSPHLVPDHHHHHHHHHHHYHYLITPLTVTNTLRGPARSLKHHIVNLEIFYSLSFIYI